MRCFSSPGSLRRYTRSVTCFQVGLPHSESVGSSVASTSPTHFVAWPRPSSALDAQASTMCSSLIMTSSFWILVILRGARGEVCHFIHARKSGGFTLILKVPTPAHHHDKTPPWWSRGDSNPGPPPCKGGALPAKLRPPTLKQGIAPLVGAPGLEPGTSALSGPRSNHLSYAPSLGHAGLPFHVWNVATHALRRCAEDEAKPVPWSSPRFLPHRGAPARPRIAPRSTNTPRLGPL